MQIPKYSSKEFMIFLWLMVPYTLVINVLVFGNCIFDGAGDFIKTFFTSLVYFAVIYIIFGMIARIINRRFPEDKALFRRIAMMLPLFYLMNILMVQGLYMIYEHINTSFCTPDRSMEWWVTGFGCLASTVITFINEAAAGWDKWKAAITETEQLKNVYKKSKLLGLKGQVNPHFLFNCFNSLSSLINEDEEAAEKFLDEMTKVHRYMLRGDEEPLVTLDEELRFARSYLYLIKARFGSAIQADIDCQAYPEPRLLPALSLQVILENIIYGNAASKADPLKIEIKCEGAMQLIVSNSVHLKTRSTDLESEDGLDNLIKKYKLLHDKPVEIKESVSRRTILLPLFNKKEVEI